jgi:hypothetical protein
MPSVTFRTNTCMRRNAAGDKSAAAAILAACADKPIRVIRSSADLGRPLPAPIAVPKPKDTEMVTSILAVLRAANTPLSSQAIAVGLKLETTQVYAACVRLAEDSRITRVNHNSSSGRPALWSI